MGRRKSWQRVRYKDLHRWWGHAGAYNVGCGLVTWMGKKIIGCGKVARQGRDRPHAAFYYTQTSGGKSTVYLCPSCAKKVK